MRFIDYYVQPFKNGAVTKTRVNCATMNLKPWCKYDFQDGRTLVAKNKDKQEVFENFFKGTAYKDNTTPLDIIFLQEQNIGQYQSLFDSTEIKYYGLPLLRTGDQSTIMYNPEKFNLIDWETILPHNQIRSDDEPKIWNEMLSRGFITKAEHEFQVASFNLKFSVKNYSVACLQCKTTFRVFVCFSCHFSGSSNSDGWDNYRNTVREKFKQYTKIWEEQGATVELIFGSDTNMNKSKRNDFVDDYLEDLGMAINTNHNSEWDVDIIVSTAAKVDKSYDNFYKNVGSDDLPVADHPLVRTDLIFE